MSRLDSLSWDRLGGFTPNSLLRAIVENTTAAIFIKDLEGRYLAVNRICEELWGLSREELLGSTDFDLLPAESAEQVRANDRQVIETGRAAQFEERIAFPAGVRVYLSSKSPILGPGGQCQGLCGVATDITARHTAHRALAEQTRQLAELDRRKDDFLAILAHELRNPLAPIVQASELLAQRSEDPEQVGIAAEVISRQVGHMSRLISDLMDAARLTRGRVTLQLDAVPVESLIERVREIIEPELDQRGHRLELELPAEPLKLRGDLDRLVQILVNLIENAARYSDDPGTIRIEAREEAGEGLISVRDQGRGIEPGRVAQLFEPFMREGEPHLAPSSGLGLGLTIVKQLVELHGGTIRAHSEGLGRGSEFVLRIPLADGGQRRGAEVVETPAKSRLSRILVVDDNQDAAEMLAELLRYDGHEVSLCHRGQEVADRVREIEPDVVLLDIGLPDLDGHEVARRLRAEHAGGLRLIAVTGYGNDADQRRSSEAGFDDHLVKPIRFDDLRRLL